MREVSNAEWDDIQDRLKEKDAEMERLQREVAFMASNDYVHSLTSEIERLKRLLTRAADALDNGDLAILGEMRKAAQ